MACTLRGPRSWSLDIDDNGYREYTVLYLVVSDSVSDGPLTAISTPGLPLPGAALAIGNDLDLWVWARPNAKAKIHQEKEGEPNKYWIVEVKFSNKPIKHQRCHDLKIEDPILEPFEVSGDIRERMVEATHDRFGKPLLMSNFEPIRGSQIEFEEDIHIIEVGNNVLNLQLALLQSMKFCVNDRPLWGMPARTILFSGLRWQRKYHGLCYKYYHRQLMFKVNERGWDRDVMDEGSKALKGHWGVVARGELEDRWYTDVIYTDFFYKEPDPKNPTHFIQIPDAKGKPTRVPLDGAGKPFYREITEDCAQCVTAPLIYKVTIGNKSYELTYLSDCGWQKIDTSVPGITTTVTLEYISIPEDILEFPYWDLSRSTAPPTISEQWYIYGDEWQCNETNKLTRYSPALGADVSNMFAGISPIGPGRHHIEKYHEANLLLLGIPPVLELA